MRLRRAQLKQWYFTGLRLLGQEGRCLARLREPGLVVLNFHRVSPHANPFWNPMPPRIFEDLLRFVTRRFHVTGFRELEPSRNGKLRAILSFDDGYRDFVEYAMPLLRRFRVTANLNIIPACVETGAPPWHMRLYDFLNAVPKSVMDRIRLPGFEVRLASEHADDKMRYGLALSRLLSQRPRRDRDALWQTLETFMAEVGPVPSTAMMSLQDVRQAAAEHEIGVHSFSHESMGLEPPAFFEDDLVRCEAFFRTQLGLPLSIYAFPNGSYRPEQVAMLQARGIEHILLVEERLARPEGRVYPRLTMCGESSPEARFQVLGYRAHGAGAT